MNPNHQESPADKTTEAERIGGRVAKELQSSFADAGFSLKVSATAPVNGNAYVDIAPIRVEQAARLIERLKEWGRSHPPADPGVPPTGTLALDIKRDRVGVVMDTLGGRVYLRPPQGGREWEAAPEHVRPAGPAEEVRAKVAEVNACRKAMR